MTSFLNVDMTVNVFGMVDMFDMTVNLHFVVLLWFIGATYWAGLFPLLLNGQRFVYPLDQFDRAFKNIWRDFVK